MLGPAQPQLVRGAGGLTRSKKNGMIHEQSLTSTTGVAVNSVQLIDDSW